MKCSFFQKGQEVLGISHVVQVTGPIGCEGWSAVAEGIQSHPGVVKLFSAPKEAMDEASREDLRKIWDAQHGTWDVKL